MNAHVFNETISLAQLSSEETSHIFQVTIHPESSVFKGHFPHIPILPGVCMVAIVKRALQTILGKTVSLQTSSAIKFMVPINPLENPRVQLKLALLPDAEAFKIDAQLVHEELVFFKMKALYK